MGRGGAAAGSIEFLTRDGCRLCDRTEAALRRAASRLGLSVRVVDVDGDEALAAEFGRRIPVVRLPGGTVLGEGDWGGAAMWVALVRARLGGRLRSRN